MHYRSSIGNGPADGIERGVSTPHRADAFAAGEWLIDSLKVNVPIWKREQWSDGTTEWVHPGIE
jgi:molybdopterin synthase catalytic subunit